MAEDRQTTLEAGEWKDCFMVDYSGCVYVWVGGGEGVRDWLAFFPSLFNMTPPMLRK